MKKFDSGEALAKEFGLAPAVLKKTFEDYNQSVRTKKDPFGKKVCIASQQIVHFHLIIRPSSSKANGNSTTSSTSPL